MPGQVQDLQVKRSIFFVSCGLDLRHEELNANLKEKGSLYIRNRDIDGKRMLIFEVKKHFRGREPVDDMKQFVLYLVERLQR